MVRINSSEDRALMRSFERALVAKVKPPKKIKGTMLQILGCGTSSGVPLLACNCTTCLSKDPKNKRTRASVVIQVGQTVFLVDTSPDLHNQARANKMYWVDSVLFTHPHADHIHGVDDLRSFNVLMAKSISCYGNAWSINTLKYRFDYIFKITQIGGGKPALNTQIIKDKPFKVHGIKIIPLPVIHGKVDVLGYRINDVAYITDCSYIPETTLRRLKKLDILILDCLRPKKHETHLNVEMALDLAKKIGAKKTYFTHMGHEIEYKSFLRQLPKNIYPAYDGLKVYSKR